MAPMAVAVAGHEALRHDDKAKEGEEPAEDEREVARAHPEGGPDLVRRRYSGEGQAERDEHETGEDVLQLALACGGPWRRRVGGGTATVGWAAAVAPPLSAPTEPSRLQRR